MSEMDFPKGDYQGNYLGFRAGTRILVKATLGCLFVHVSVSFIHETYLNPHLEDSSSNLTFSLGDSTFQARHWTIPRFR